jgi:hypothetical protein
LFLFSQDEIVKINKILPKLQKRILASRKHISSFHIFNAGIINFFLHLSNSIDNRSSWLCRSDLARLRQWTSPFINKTDELTSRGRDLMRNLGQRMHSRLYNDMFSAGSLDINKQIKIQVTKYIRTNQSANEYVDGLLTGYSTDRPSNTHNNDNAYLLMYPGVCAKYIQVNQTSFFFDKKAKIIN